MAIEERRVLLEPYENGRTWKQDENYVIRFKTTLHGITREYGRRPDGRIVLLNIKEVLGKMTIFD